MQTHSLYIEDNQNPLNFKGGKHS